jgi:hypothetical protein
MGNYDLRGLEKGYSLVSSKKYISTCSVNCVITNWFNPEVKSLQRRKALKLPLGFNIEEYKIFRNRFWPENYTISIFKVYMRCIISILINKIHNLNA